AQGDPGGSLAQLSGLFKSGAGDLKAGPSLVLSLLQAGKVAEAANTAQTLVKREPDNILYQELAGATFVAQRKYADAEGVFKRIPGKQAGRGSSRPAPAQAFS